MHRYTVELRVSGKALDPDEVTRKLALNPSQIRRKGERRSEKSIWPDSMWSFEVLPPGQDDWSSLEEGLVATLKLFSPIRSQLQSFLPGNEIYVWCGHFTSSFGGGPTFSPAMLKSLGDFGVELILET